MHLRFGRDEEAAFERTAAALVEEFDELRPAAGEGGLDARLALDWKWGYGDGDLGAWQLEDLDEFLLEWCPQHVAIPADEGERLTQLVSDLLAFLASGGLLGPGSAPLDVLQSHLAGMGERVVAALDDPARFGMAKSMFSAMTDLGELPDNLDELDLDGLADRFNALPFDERGRILGLGDPYAGPWQHLTAGIPLTPAPLVTTDDLLAIIDETPIVQQVLAVRAFVGEGRKLTAKGNLTVVDAKALAADLDDPALAMAAEHHFEVRSADDLPTMQFVLRWARAAGAVRVAKGRLHATASWAKLDAVAAIERLASTLIDKGPVSLHTADNQWSQRALVQVVDEGVPHLLALLWAVPEPLDFEELLDAIVEICELRLQFPSMATPESTRRQIRYEIDLLFDVLTMAGVVTRRDSRTVADEYGSDRREGGTLAMTALGRAVLGDHLRTSGYPVPTAGELAELPLSALFERIGAWHPDRTRTEFDHWVRRQSPDQAVDEMAALLDSYEDPQWPVAALDLINRLGAPTDETAARRFLATPARGHAIGWLLEHGHTDVPDDPAAMMRSGLELLSLHLIGAGDDEFLEIITKIDDLESFVDNAGRISVPAASSVLDGIARLHPDQSIAKAARKAAMRQRSRTTTGR